jgi:hypothetical protein
MSEVLTAVKESSTQNPKVVIATILSTALTTILVAFIGVVPQLRHSDAEELKALKQDFENLKGKAAAASGASISSDKKMDVRGTATTLDGKRTLNGYDVFLLPEGNNLLTTKTDDSGRFTLSGIPAGTYSIIIRDSTQGTSGKGLLDESEEVVKVIGAQINYRIKQ